jgi:CHAT domain-containing protein
MPEHRESWTVSGSTSELMKRFYQGMLGPDSLPPGRGVTPGSVVDLEAEAGRAPYYWAAFILQGEWQ